MSSYETLDIQFFVSLTSHNFFIQLHKGAIVHTSGICCDSLDVDLLFVYTSMANVSVAASFR